MAPLKIDRKIHIENWGKLKTVEDFQSQSKILGYGKHNSNKFN